jgi:hypothetical protein
MDFVFKDMSRTALTVSANTTCRGCTVGTLTPTERFVQDKNFPEETRYSVPEEVIDRGVAASPAKMSRLGDSLERMAKKRARLAASQGNYMHNSQESDITE